jgi:hypothetical protein
VLGAAGAVAHWSHSRRSELIRLRVAIRKGEIDPSKRDAILAVVREGRRWPGLKRYLARSLDRCFAALQAILARAPGAGETPNQGAEGWGGYPN